MRGSSPFPGLLTDRKTKSVRIRTKPHGKPESVRDDVNAKGKQIVFRTGRGSAEGVQYALTPGLICLG